MLLSSAQADGHPPAHQQDRVITKAQRAPPAAHSPCFDQRAPLGGLPAPIGYFRHHVVVLKDGLIGDALWGPETGAIKGLGAAQKNLKTSTDGISPPPFPAPRNPRLSFSSLLAPHLCSSRKGSIASQLP